MAFASSKMFFTTKSLRQCVAECVQPFCDLLLQEHCWQPERFGGYGDSGLADLEGEFSRHSATGEFAVYAIFAEFLVPLHATPRQ